MRISYIQVFCSIFKLFSLSHFYNYSRYKNLSEQFNHLQDILPVNHENKPEIFLLLNHWGGATVLEYQLYLGKVLSSHNFKVNLMRDGYNLFPNFLTFVFNLTFKPKERHKAVKRAKSFAYRRRVYTIVRSNIIWFTRSELIFIVLPKFLMRFLFKKQSEHIESKHALINSMPDDTVLIIPGGILSVSATYVFLAEERSLLYYTYDSGVDGQVLFGKKSVAAHLVDIEKFNVDKLSSKQRVRLKERALELISQRRNGTDKFSLQKVSIKFKVSDLRFASSKKHILVALTCPWDAASLQRNDRFSGEMNFLKWVIKKFPSYQVIIRMHPIERHKFARRHDNLNRFFRDVPNVELISADADVNSYDLLSNVDLMICRNTSLGAEAHLLGIPVYATTLSYWNDNKELTKTKLPDEEIYIKYALAQSYSYIFPECNLSNVRHKIHHLSDFDLFAKMISNRRSMIEEVLANEKY